MCRWNHEREGPQVWEVRAGPRAGQAERVVVVLLAAGVAWGGLQLAAARRCASVCILVGRLWDGRSQETARRIERRCLSILYWIDYRIVTAPEATETDSGLSR